MSVQILQGDVMDMLATLDDESVDMVVTSPPYWGLRNYGVEGQIGMEPTLDEHIEVLVKVFREIRRVLKKTGTVWLNYGDCYATSPNGRSAADTKAAGKDDRTFRDKPFSTIKESGLPKGNLCLLPEKLIVKLQADGWCVRSNILWAKRNGKPDSRGNDRPSHVHERIFLLTHGTGHNYDAVAVRLPCAGSTKARLAQNIEQQEGSFRQPGKTNGAFKAVGNGQDRLLRDYEPEVWPMITAAFTGSHFATFPPELVERCVMAGCRKDGVVLDPFGGAGTTALVAEALGRDSIMIELNPDYCDLMARRIRSGLGRIENYEQPEEQEGLFAVDKYKVAAE